MLSLFIAEYYGARSVYSSSNPDASQSLWLGDKEGDNYTASGTVERCDRIKMDKD